MKTLDSWRERDLMADARAGKLDPAFEIDETIGEIAEMLEAGHCPIVTGDSGVGRTAAVHELVRRVCRGDGPACLSRRHIVEVSLMRKAASPKERYHIRAHFQELIEALQKSGRKVALFIRDIHLAYEFDLEPQLLSLAAAFDGPVIGEGPRVAVDCLLEHDQGLQQHYVCVQMEEPDLDRASRILTAWADDAEARRGRVFTPEALDQALTLTHRFLARGRLPRKALDALRHASALVGAGRPVTGRAVLDRFCAIHRVPRDMVDPQMPLDLGALRASFARRVVGQPEAIDAVVDMIALMKAGLSDPRRPLGVFLFAGPTGVGKTYVAQLLAQRLFGNPERVVRFNMADHAAEHDAGVLFGDPTANSLTGMRGLVTTRVMAHPMGVVLLDEFEKSHAKVHDRFLQLFDEGAFVNGAGETVSCRSMVIIATSNAGAEAYRGQQFGFGANGLAKRLETARAALEAHFRFELLNRFDRVVHFLPLQRETVRRIAERELEALCNRIGVRRGRFLLELDESIVAWVTQRGYGPEYGARLLRRTIERYVATALAETIVSEQPEHGSTIVLTVEDDRVVARVHQDNANACAEVPLEVSAARSVAGERVNGRSRRRSIRFWESKPKVTRECL